jgi:hypothetical protein
LPVLAPVPPASRPSNPVGNPPVLVNPLAAPLNQNQQYDAKRGCRDNPNQTDVIHGHSPLFVKSSNIFIQATATVTVAAAC